MEDGVQILGPQVPKARCIAWNALTDTVITRASRSVWSQTFAPFANAKAEAVAGTEVGMVARGAGNVAVARQDAIIE
ncbi:hypothetical protein GCM10007385_30180 [Tateyamaria omphalii]|nr:hypothetical protein GCM10007385_30180 [Tateyamaria omphalii]